MWIRILGAALLAANLAALPAQAGTVRWASSSEVSTLDPHAVFTIPHLTLLHQIYDTLVVRTAEGKLAPSLATSWRMIEDDPTIWEFTLRPGVRFQDGAPLTAQDVVFSLKRAQGQFAQVRAVLSGLHDVEAVDPLTVHVRTKVPNLIFPEYLAQVFVVNEAWARANGGAAVPDLSGNQSGIANIANIANGTGAYRLVSHAAGSKTVLRRNPTYWGRDQYPLDVGEIVYLPIRADATRMAALLSGQVDLVQDIPAQDVARLRQDSRIRVNESAENRVIAYGLNVGPTLHHGNVQGKNPLADPRVREAMELAIDRETLQRTVMRGLSVPTGHLAGSLDNGFDARLVAYAKPDLARAKALLREAGYPDGFPLTLDTSNDRYVNDEAVSTAVAGFLSRIGIQVQVASRPMAQHLPLFVQAKTDFFLFGLGAATFDSGFFFDFLFHTRGKNGHGIFNATGYSNAEVDDRIAALETEIDKSRRDAMIAELWDMVARERVYIPLHYQMQHIASIPSINLPVPPDSIIHLKTIAFEP